MANRILNRRELRKSADPVPGPQAIASEIILEPMAAKKKAKAKAKAAGTPKVRKVRAKKAPARVRARWGVFDGGMKQVAIFDYSQRTAADEKLADLRAKKKGLHFLQTVKDPMPEPVPVETAVME